ncbi:hypothetical protein FB45DRAFT_918306 [Roridomyces roridus]|uniref:Uncharacterized protein n=1 Tax=Roridomyces roridus TaxID=1738132 RepID=A0AAD7BQY7_9AGAR|nr:hypothetical protein FB45DRAFT_918306 [Roridomyces roridus]
MSVPQELVNLIVDNLAGDIPNLKSCSLAARAFVQPSQKHIFKQIVVLSATVCQRFHQLLTSSAHLATFVDELRVVSGGLYQDERKAAWVMSESTLALVLPLLHLKCISLVGNAPSSGTDFTIDWAQVNQSLKSALAAIFSSPDLESVRIRGLVIQSPTELLSLFQEATRLKSFAVSCVQYTLLHLPWPDSRPWRPQLTSLLISEATLTLCPYFLNPPFDLSRVTSLTIAGVLDLDRKNKLIEATASNPLQHLAVMYAHEIDFRPDLRSIRIFTMEIMLSTVRAFFVSCPPDSQLETITFDGLALNGESGDPSLNNLVASTLTQLPRLRTITMRGYEMPGTSTFSEWSASIHATLPCLVTRGLLTIKELTQKDFRTDWE